jgi:hypothetical protein
VRVLLVFVDGVGLGSPGAHNPFDGAPVEILAPLGGADARGRGDVAYARVDATLGYPGLPQSATGQAALYTGEDAVARAGGHREGWPTRAVAELLAERSIFARARARGLRAAFLNAFDDARAARVTRIVRGHEARPKRFPISASSLAALAGGGELRAFDDVRRGRAATFDLTGEVIRAHGYAAPRLTIRDAAEAVAAGAAELDLALFEMFLTDSAGHAQDTTWARHEILRTERFLSALFAAVDLREQLVVVTSDHGNLEDLSTRSHTRAEVPLLAFGAGAATFARGLRDLRDVGTRILDLAGAADARIAGPSPPLVP